VLGVGDLAGVAVLVIAASLRGRPFDEAAEDRAAGRAGAAAAGEQREVLLRRLLAERSGGGEGQRRESGGGGGEAPRGGEGVARRHSHRLLAAGPLADTVELRAHPAGELGVGGAETAVRLGAPDLVLAAVIQRLDRALAHAVLQRHRDGGVHRSRAREVAGPPIFDEGDIGRRGYRGLAHASVSRRSPSAPKCTGWKGKGRRKLQPEIHSGSA